MLATFAFVLSLLALAAAVGSLWLSWRGRQARAELTQRLHDTALGLDRRCDALQQQLDALTLARKIDQLDHLVQLSEHRRCLEPAVARRLEHFVQDLRMEATQPTEAG